jgi:MFS family permease
LKVRAQIPDKLQAAISRGPLSGLTRNVVVLGLVSLLADVSTEMLYPLLPLFLTSVLGTPLPLVGLIEGFAEAVASLFKLLSGRWSDRTGKRRRFILTGYGLAALGKGLLALAGAWPLALLARSVDRLGKGLRGSPRDALLADSVEPRYLGKALGWHRGMDSLGAVIGPLLALLLLRAASGQIRTVLWYAVIPGLIGTALVLTVRDPRKQPSFHATQTAGEGLQPQLRRFLGTWAIFAFTNSSDVFILLRAKELGLSITLVVLLYALYNLTYSLGSPILGGLADRYSPMQILRGGLIVFAFTYAGFALAGSLTVLAVLFGIYGIYMAATDGVGKALVIQLAGGESKATAVGYLGLLSGLGALFASTLAGILWEKAGPAWVFAIASVGAVVTVAMLSPMRPGAKPLQA